MSDSSITLTFLKLMFALPLVMVLAYLFIKYVLSRSPLGAGGNRGGTMRLVARLSLGPKSWLDMVQVGDRYYLLGHNEGAFSLLREFEQMPGLPDQEAWAEGQNNNKFLSYLKAQMNRTTGKPE